MIACLDKIETVKFGEWETVQNNLICQNNLLLTQRILLSVVICETVDLFNLFFLQNCQIFNLCVNQHYVGVDIF